MTHDHKIQYIGFIAIFAFIAIFFVFTVQAITDGAVSISPNSQPLNQNDQTAFGGSFVEFSDTTPDPTQEPTSQPTPQPTQDPDSNPFKPDSPEDWSFLPQNNYVATEATRYASPSGANSGDGTSKATPVSLNRAIELAQPGDVVILLEGIYNQQMNVIDKDGSDTSPIVFTSEPGKPRTAIISHGSGHIARFLRSDHIIVDSLVFDGQKTSIWGVSTGRQFSADQNIGTARDFTFIGNEIKNVGKENALNISLIDTALVRNNHIYDAGPPDQDRGEGIYLGCGACPQDQNISRNIILEGNKIQNVGAEGIEQKAGVRNVIIRDNLILDSGWNQTYNNGGTCCFGAAIVVHLLPNRPNFSSNATIERNRVGRISYSGFVVGAGSTTVQDNLAWATGVNHRDGFGSAGSTIPRSPYTTNISFHGVFNDVEFINNYAAEVNGKELYFDSDTYGQPEREKADVTELDINLEPSADAAFDAWITSSFND